MRDFFQALYGQCSTGFVSLWARKGDDKPSVHIRVTSLERLTPIATQLDQADWEVYFGVGLRGQDLGRYKRGSEDDVIAIPGFWADVDYGSRGHAAKNLPPTVEDAAKLFDEAGLDPTILVDSGGGLHAYFLFHQPWVFVGTADRTNAKRQSGELQKRLQDAAKAHGWHVDSTPDLARVLRVPGTMNRKAEPHVQVRVLLSNGPRFEVTQPTIEVDDEHQRRDPILRRSDKAGELAIGADAKASKSAETVGEGGTVLPSVARKNVLEAFKRVRKEPLRTLCQAVLKQEPFSAPGKRDEDLNRLCSMIGDVDPDTDAEELVKVLYPAIDATADRDQDWEPETIYQVALDKLTRAQRRGAEKKARDEEIKAAFLTKGASTLEAVKPEVAKTFKDYAAEQGHDPTSFLKHLVIKNSDAHYVFSHGRYQQPIQSSDLDISLPRDWVGMPIEWEYQAGEETKRKSLKMLMNDYATVARRVVADMTIDRSYYDPTDQTFYEAICAKRNLEPAYCPEVDKWLHLLGGARAEKLLDWTATITRLDQYTSALYLGGARGVGKSLYAVGVARIYTTGGPTEMKRILENFNSDLTKCPIIFSDEELPTGRGGHKSTTQLREMVTSKSRTLSRKFLPNADLRGATRIILSANNDSMLAVGEENLSSEDLDAFGDRFLYIEVGEAARDYLNSLGGQKYVTHWVDDDVIAKHVLWLAQNREVVPGKRFLVEGEKSAIKRGLATKGYLTARCCEWLARHLDSPKPIVAQNKRIRVGGGEILVNAEAMIKHWADYIDTKRDSPTIGNMVKALGHISKAGVKDRRLDGARARSVDVEMFLEWADEHQIGDLEKMKASIEAPLRGGDK